MRIDVEKPILQDEQVKLIASNQSQRRRSAELNKTTATNLPLTKQSTSKVAHLKNSNKVLQGVTVKDKIRLSNRDPRLNQSLKKHKHGFPASKITFDKTQFALHRKRLAPPLCRTCVEKKVEEKDPRLSSERYRQVLLFRCLACFCDVKASGSRVDTFTGFSCDSVSSNDYGDCESNVAIPFSSDTTRNKLNSNVLSAEELTKKFLSDSIPRSNEVLSVTKDGSSISDENKFTKATEQLPNEGYKKFSGLTSAILTGASGASIAEISNGSRDPRLKSNVQRLNVRRSNLIKGSDDAHKVRQLELMRQLIKSPCKKKCNNSSRKKKTNLFKRKPLSMSLSAKILNKANVVEKMRFRTRNYAEDKEAPNHFLTSSSVRKTTDIISSVSVKQENVSRALDDKNNFDPSKTINSDDGLIVKPETEQIPTTNLYPNSQATEVKESLARKEVATQMCRVSSNLNETSFANCDTPALSYQVDAAKNMDEGKDTKVSVSDKPVMDIESCNTTDLQKEFFAEQTTSCSKPSSQEKEKCCDEPQSSALLINAQHDSSTHSNILDTVYSQDVPSVLPCGFFEDDLPTLNVKPSKRKRHYCMAFHSVINKTNKDITEYVNKDILSSADQPSLSDNGEKICKQPNLEAQKSDNSELVAVPKNKSLEQLNLLPEISSDQENSVSFDVLQSGNKATKNAILSELVDNEVSYNASVHLTSLPKHLNLQPTVRLIDTLKTSPTLQEKFFPIAETSLLSMHSTMNFDDSSISKAEFDSPMSPIVIYDSEEENPIKAQSTSVPDRDATVQSNFEPVTESRLCNITTPPSSPHDSDDSQTFMYKNTKYHWPYSSPSIDEIKAMSDDESVSDYEETKTDIIVPLIRLEESGYVPKCFLYVSIVSIMGRQVCNNFCTTFFCIKQSNF